MLITDLHFDIINYIYQKLPINKKIIFRNITYLYRKELKDILSCIYEKIQKHNKFDRSRSEMINVTDFNYLDLYYSFNNKLFIKDLTKIGCYLKNPIIDFREKMENHINTLIFCKNCINGTILYHKFSGYEYLEMPHLDTLKYYYNNNKLSNYNEYTKNISTNGIVYFNISYRINTTETTYVFGICKDYFYIIKHIYHEGYHLSTYCDIYTIINLYLNKIKYYLQLFKLKTNNCILAPSEIGQIPILGGLLFDDCYDLINHIIILT